MSITLSDSIATAHPKPEFDYYRKNTGGLTYVDWTNQADVISNVPITRRPHKTFRISGIDYICEQDGTTFTPKFGDKMSITITTDGSQPIPAGRFIKWVTVFNAAGLSSFNIGSTSGGQEFATTQSVPANDETTFTILKGSGSGITLYFGGITGSTQIKIYSE